MALSRLPWRESGRGPLSAPRGDGRVVRLPDGRRLGYLEYGDPAGCPIFFFHGFGSTRLMRHPDESIPASLGVRIISVDRPGIGLSDPRPGRRLLDWPKDVLALAHALEVRRFAVLGWSGGGPYALACAHALPDQVTAAGVISGPAPLLYHRASEYLTRRRRGVARVAWRAPWILRVAIWRWGRPQRRDPVLAFDAAVEGMVASDQALMADPRVREIMIENATEVFRQGGRGMYDEGLVLAGPWGFGPADIAAPVYLWHGDLDDTVPTEMAHHLARTIPDCHATFYPDEGHHLLYHRWSEILTTLVRSFRRAD